MSIKAELMEKTVAELRQMCTTNNIKGMSKKRKDVIVDAIVKHTSAKKRKISSAAKKKAIDPNFVDRASFSMDSQLTKPTKRFGDRTTTVIKVSCGAASGDFPVCGKSVGAVKNFLREVLNINNLASGLVNGDKIEDNYILKEGDGLEFLKPAGEKG